MAQQSVGWWRAVTRAGNRNTERPAWAEVSNVALLAGRAGVLDRTLDGVHMC